MSCKWLKITWWDFINRQCTTNIVFDWKTASYLCWMSTLSFVGLAFRFQSSHHLVLARPNIVAKDWVHFIIVALRTKSQYYMSYHHIHFQTKQVTRSSFCIVPFILILVTTPNKGWMKQIMSTFYLVKQFLTNYTSIQRKYNFRTIQSIWA